MIITDFITTDMVRRIPLPESLLQEMLLQYPDDSIDFNWYFEPSWKIKHRAAICEQISNQSFLYDLIVSGRYDRLYHELMARLDEETTEKVLRNRTDQ